MRVVMELRDVLNILPEGHTVTLYKTSDIGLVYRVGRFNRNKVPRKYRTLQVYQMYANSLDDICITVG